VPLEETSAIDIGIDTGDGSAELCITDAGITIDQEQRLNLLREKLRTYASYINGSEFESDFPGIPRDRVTIRVVCANPPTAEMARISAIRIKGENPINVPITYKVMPSPSRGQ
jgi:hypothetical protein